MLLITVSTASANVPNRVMIEPPLCSFNNSCTPEHTTTTITQNCNTGFFFDYTSQKCLPDLKPNFTVFFFIGLLTLGIIYKFVRK